jgi:AraC-like DNA-binding protein
VLEGTGTLDVPGIGAFALSPGDVLLLREAILPSPPATVRLLAGSYRLDPLHAPLRRWLPPTAQTWRHDPAAARLNRVADLLAHEASSLSPGRGLVLDRLGELLFLEILRLALAHPAPPGLIAGLTDPWVVRALEDVHGDVARCWTVAALAQSSGLSRALFADRFLRRMGVTPMRYVLDWRMELAKEFLDRHQLRPGQVAPIVGYRSVTGLGKALARHANPSAP